VQVKCNIECIHFANVQKERKALLEAEKANMAAELEAHHEAASASQGDDA
jgi:hypothetical protein